GGCSAPPRPPPAGGAGGGGARQSATRGPYSPAGRWCGEHLIPRRHRRHGVTASTNGFEPTVMSVGSLVRVATSIVDTVSLPLLATKAVLPSGVTATPPGNGPTGMSVGAWVLAARGSGGT